MENMRAPEMNEACLPDASPSEIEIPSVSWAQDSDWADVPEIVFVLVERMLLDAFDSEVHRKSHRDCNMHIGWRMREFAASFRLVCKNWRRMHDRLCSGLWLTSLPEPGDHASNQESNLAFMRRFPHIRRLVWDARLSAINIWGSVLADAAALWPWLTSVSLVEWKLEVEEELGALAELPALTSLEIIRCRGLSDAGVHALDACTSLSQLSLKGNVDITGDGAAALGSLTRLTGLNLSGCKSVGDDGVRALSPQLRRLRIVNLAGCMRLTDAGMAALGDVESLESLNLAECDLVSEEGVEELGRLTNLRRLNLRHVCVTETGVRALRRLSALASLELIGNMDLSESGLEAAVSQFPKMRSVSLSSSPTWSARALAAHGTWPELTTLEVDCSYMTDPRWTVGRFKALTSLQIFGLFSLADVVVKALADLPVLTTLCLGRDNVLTGTGLRTIGNSLGNLTRLDLSGCTSEMLGVTCEDVNVLGKLTRLTELDVSGLIELTNVGASSLCGLQSLEHLSLEGCVHITDQGVGALADLRSLTSIDLRHCPRMSGKGIQALRTNLTGLKRLRLGSYSAKLPGSTSSSKVIAEGLDIMSS